MIFHPNKVLWRQWLEYCRSLHRIRKASKVVGSQSGCCCERVRPGLSASIVSYMTNCKSKEHRHKQLPSSPSFSGRFQFAAISVVTVPIIIWTEQWQRCLTYVRCTHGSTSTWCTSPRHVRMSLANCSCVREIGCVYYFEKKTRK